MLSMVAGSPTMLSASWMVPDPTNGVITGYTIRCSSTPLGMLPPFIISASVTETNLENLTPFTSYSCSISANTSAGEGGNSNMETATTDEDCKSQYLNIRNACVTLFCHFQQLLVWLVKLLFQSTWSHHSTEHAQ